MVLLHLTGRSIRLVIGRMYESAQCEYMGIPMPLSLSPSPSTAARYDRIPSSYNRPTC